MDQEEEQCFGLDLGTKKAVLAKAEWFKSEVILNESMNRETEVVIGFKEQERFIGEQAALQYRSNILKTLKGFTAILGRNVDDKCFSMRMDNNLYDFGHIKLNAVQLTGSLVKKIMMEKNGELVISVPDYYTEFEIISLLRATQIAQLFVKCLIPEWRAISNFIQINKKVEQNILIIDFGHSKFSCSVLDCSGNLICQVFDRHLGTKYMDIILCDWIVNQLQSKPNDKQYYRILDYCEQIRKTLSANNDYNIDIENVDNGNDYIQLFSRDQFNQLIHPIIQRISQLLQNIIQQLNHKQINLQCIELLGGGSRIPIFLQTIADLFQGIQIKKTLNATETISQGCALSGIIMNQSKYQPQNKYPIYIAYTNHKININPQSTAQEIRQIFGQQVIQYYDGLLIQNSNYFVIFYDPPPFQFPYLIKTIESPKIHNQFFTDINGLVSAHDCNIQYIQDYRVEELSMIEEQLITADNKHKTDQQDKYLLEKTIYDIEREMKTKNLSMKQFERVGQELESIKDQMQEQVNYLQLREELIKMVEDIYQM